jgi:hypothetical protein
MTMTDGKSFVEITQKKVNEAWNVCGCVLACNRNVTEPEEKKNT